MAEPIRVIIVDDHPLLREGTQASLERSADIVVVGLAGDGAAALKLAKSTHPDVVLLDLRLPDISGVEVANQLLASQPGIAILVITGYDEVGYVRSLLERGVSGYLRKTATGEEIVTAVRSVAAGRVYLPDEILRQVEQSGPSEPLTRRELEVLSLLVAGQRNTEIAGKLMVSVKTVEFHVGNILAKLGARSRSEAIHSARLHHLVDPFP